MEEQRWLASLAGRNVALVGAAESGVGTGLGPLIEGHDVVVRVNWACPIPSVLTRDLGSRTDVLYHVLTAPASERHPRGPVRREHVDAWLAAGVGALVGITGQKTAINAAQVLAASVGMPFFRLPMWLSRALAVDLETTPNAGIAALTHLLRSDLARLSLYAFDFYVTGHWPGQLGETPTQAAAQVGGWSGHGQSEQRAYVRRLLDTDGRLVVLPNVRELL